MAVSASGSSQQQNDYYPFGMEFASGGVSSNKYKYNGKEAQDDLIGGKKLGWLDYGARMYDPSIGRFHKQDRFAEKYYDFTPYQYAANNPISNIDINGDSIVVYVFDQTQQPTDDYKEANYTALIYVDVDGYVHGPYRGSSYPDSKKDESETEHNTVSEEDHDYNNESGHKGGSKKGLNIDDSNNNSRTSTGKDPDGNDIQMQYVNVHKGYFSRRFSEGCITLHPNDWTDFTSHFDWSNGNGNKGNSTGTIGVYRGKRSGSLNKLKEVGDKVNKQYKQLKQKPTKSGFINK